MQLYSCPKASYLKVSLVNTLDVEEDEDEEEAVREPGGELTGESVFCSNDSSVNAFDPFECCN